MGVCVGGGFGSNGFVIKRSNLVVLLVLHMVYCAMARVRTVNEPSFDKLGSAHLREFF
jgi:hypothetical protein